MDIAIFGIAESSFDNQIPPAHERKGNVFWAFLNGMLGLPPERYPRTPDDGSDWRIQAMRRREGAIAALNRPQPPGPLASIVGDVVDHAREAVKDIASKVAKVTKTQRAVEWLAQVLRDGPVPQKEIEARAIKEKIGSKPLKLAKQKLKVQSTRKGRAAWAWVLPMAKPKEDSPA